MDRARIIPPSRRFMSEDPKLFDAGDYNLFRYCHNDPVDNVDPMGLDFLGYESFGDYAGQVGQTALGELKGAASVLSLGVYQPSSTNINQQAGIYVGQALTIVAAAAIAKAESKPTGAPEAATEMRTSTGNCDLIQTPKARTPYSKQTHTLETLQNTKPSLRKRIQEIQIDGNRKSDLTPLVKHISIKKHSNTCPLLMFTIQKQPEASVHRASMSYRHNNAVRSAPMDEGALEWLQTWYDSHTNGDWEHHYGIKIDTLDNPGWSLRIDLTDTGLEGRTFAPIQIERTQHDWLFCRVEDDVFMAYCGSKNLAEAISVFRDWASKKG